LKISTLNSGSKGKVNAESTSWTAIINAFEITFTEFATVFDGITDSEISMYRMEIENAPLNTPKKKSFQKKKK
jgi:hypothetical protein